MISMIRLLFVLKVFAFAGLAQGATSKSKVVLNPGDTAEIGNVEVIVKEPVKTPIKSERCLKQSPSGVCSDKEITFSVQGASCTEDCFKYGTMDQCEIRNSCNYDSKSGCFKKKVCTSLTSVGSCAEWKEEANCG